MLDETLPRSLKLFAIAAFATGNSANAGIPITQA